MFRYPNGVFLFIFGDICFKRCRFYFEFAVYGGKIVLLNVSVFYGVVEFAQRCGILCRNDDPAGIPVQPVGKRRCKGFDLRIPFAVFIKMPFYGGYQNRYTYRSACLYILCRPGGRAFPLFC